MSDFRKMRLTPDGRELLALAHQGTPLEFSAIVLGNGVWTEAQQADASVSALVSQKVSVTITKITQTGDSARLEALLTNAALVAGFSITEIGIIAAHPTRGNILYMVDYCAPEKASYIQSKDGVPIEVPLAIDVLVASSQDVTLTIDDRFFGATRQDISDHNNRPDAHGVLLDSVRAHAPLVIVAGSADIWEGESTQLLIQDWHTYEWASEVKVRITDAGGTDRTALWTVTPNLTTGRIDLTAPQVDADQTYGVAVQVWEHGLVRSHWTQPLTINVGDVPINRPAITAPAAGATGVGETPTITTGAFSADADQTHADAQMQIATDSGFAAIVRDTGSLGPVTAYAVPPGILTTGHVYYVRARHKGSDGNWSPWSPVSSFFTAASFIYVDRPVNTSPVAGAGEIGETPTLAASAYSTNGTGDHAHTRFQVDVAGGDFSAPVHDSGLLGAVTEYAIPAGVLDVATQYIWRVQYTDDSAGPVASEWSSPTAFTTAQTFLTPWPEWDEMHEMTLAHPDTFVCLFDNPNAGGNELGSGGGLSGTAATLVQGGNLPGATGSPGRRTFDAAHYLTIPEAVLQMLCRTQFTLVLKRGPTNNVQGSAITFHLGPSVAAPVYLVSMGMWHGAGNTSFEITVAGANIWDYKHLVASYVEEQALFGNADLYFAIWSDGANVRVGISKVKPTKLSEIAVHAVAQIPPSSFALGTPNASKLNRINNYVYNAQYWPLNGAYHYLVVSRECLIDNNA
ncbi:phage tail-collar fiber domain-containing protein [Desulfovibrio psychrotolerans]|uniref:Phage tail fibre protein N-terminal domain-containing protein n=1 Tax=Desulfovibrio psychrotolerans TaxID=415242 RepID=A0A7J0BXA5_9BACT|nr:phage tail protein [Desulfovibrio psychrotolerans]GFM38323.1 hypothetical protein DSM19430T_30070 [Desulfovibrio psychrotolerans]